MIDYHCHILPGMDDGCRDLSEALEMASIMMEVGFKEIYCTPHCIRGVYDNDPAIVSMSVASLQKELDQCGIPIKLHPGMEYYLDEFFLKQLQNLQTLGTTNMVLVESPSQADPDMIENIIGQIIRKGFKPVFAHPERYGSFMTKSSPKGILQKIRMCFGDDSHDDFVPSKILDNLKTLGCLFQGNLGSFVGQYGENIKGRAYQLKRKDYYDLFGTDSHRPDFVKKLKLQNTL